MKFIFNLILISSTLLLLFSFVKDDDKNTHLYSANKKMRFGNNSFIFFHNDTAIFEISDNREKLGRGHRIVEYLIKNDSFYNNQNHLLYSISNQKYILKNIVNKRETIFELANKRLVSDYYFTKVFEYREQTSRIIDSLCRKESDCINKIFVSNKSLRGTKTREQFYNEKSYYDSILKSNAVYRKIENY